MPSKPTTLPVIRETEPAKMLHPRLDERPSNVATVEGAGIWLVGRDMKIVWMNDVMQRIYGPLSEKRPRHCYEIFRGQDHRCADCLPTKAFSSEQIVTGFISRTTPDNVQRCYQVIEAPLLDDKNEVSRVLEIVLDVTEKARLEQNLKESEAEYRALFEHAGTAVVVVNNRGRIVRANQEFEELSGCSKEELAETGKFERFVHPKHRKREKKSERSWEFAFLNRAGAERFVHATISHLPHSGHQVLSIIDMTKQRRMEQRLIQQEKMLALGDLASSLAHEIKNPLNSMVINAELLKSNPKEPQRYVNILTTEIARLNKVIEKVLSFSKPIEGTYEKVDLAAVINHVVGLMSPQAKQQKVKLKCKLQKGLPHIEGINDHLIQIFINLFLNAFYAMPQGGTLHVTGKSGKQNRVVIDVEDTGVGIPKGDYKKVFDLYFSTKEKGSGIGLPLVKRLVTTHEGTITFRSRVRHGTTFTITFPSA